MYFFAESLGVQAVCEPYGSFYFDIFCCFLEILCVVCWGQ